MKLIFSCGHLISSVDEKVMAFNDVVNIYDWFAKGVENLADYAILNIQKKYLPLLKKDSEITDIPVNDIEALLNLIETRPYFSHFNKKSPPLLTISRTFPRDITILSQGIEIEDYQYSAMKKYFENIEDYLHCTIENKIWGYRHRILLLGMTGDDGEWDLSIPMTEDNAILSTLEQPRHKNRKQKDQESPPY